MIREQLDSDSHVISNQISNLINTPIEQNFERLARMSRRLFDVPVIVIGLFDEKRKSIKPVVALDFSDSSIYVPLFNEFNSDDILVVEDASKDENFKDHPLVVQDPMIRFIVICPIFEKNGKKVGSLIMMDHKPRTLGLNDLMSLNEIVKLIETEIITFSISKAQKLMLQEISNEDRSLYIDASTRAWNYDGCNKILNFQVNESKKDHSHFALALIDIDNLGKINKQFGRDIGDTALALTAKTVLRSIRDEDTIGRGKNADFMVIIHANSLENIKTIANRIKANIDKEEIHLPEGKLSYNVTLGVAFFDEKIDNAESLVKNAKIALTKGKKAGRNRIEFI